MQRNHSQKLLQFVGICGFPILVSYWRSLSSSSLFSFRLVSLLSVWRNVAQRIGNEGFVGETQPGVWDAPQSHTCKVLPCARGFGWAGLLILLRHLRWPLTPSQSSKYQKHKKKEKAPKQALKEASKKAKREKVSRFSRAFPVFTIRCSSAWSCEW